MIKKILIILTVTALAAGLIGCGGGNSTSDTPTGVNPNVVSRVELMATSYVNQTNGYCYLKTKVIDGNGSPIKNRQVVYTNLSATGVLDFTQVNTDANGIATATLYSTVAGFATIQAEVNADNTGTEKIRDRKTVFFTPFDMCWGGDCGGTGANLAALTLNVDSDNNGIYDEPSDFIMFDPAGKSDALIRATVLGSSGAPLLNSAVTFGSDSPEVTFPLASSPTAPVVHTNVDGQASVLARVAPAILRNTESTVNITAKADNNTFNVLTLFLKPVTVNTVTVAADPSTVESAGTSKISAIVKTNAGNPVPANTIVNFAASAGTIVPFGPTDATGLATAQFKAPTVTTAQNVTVTANVGGKSGSTSVTVTPASVALTVIPDTQTIGNPIVGSTARYTVTGGTAPYRVFSDIPATVQVSITSNTVTAMVASIPTVDTTATISVFDAVGAKKDVKLVLDVPPTVALTVIPDTQTMAPPIAIGNTARYTIIGGTSPYSVYSDKPAIVQATVSGTTVTARVNSVPAGTTTVTLSIFDATGAKKNVTLILDPLGTGGGGGTGTVTITPATVTVIGVSASSTDQIQFVTNGGTGSYNCVATPQPNAAGIVDPGIQNDLAIWTINPNAVIATTVVTIRCTDTNGASAVSTVTVSPPVFDLILDKINVIGQASSANGPSNLITATVTGGSGPFVVSSDNTALTSPGIWSFSATPFTFTFYANNVATATTVTLTAVDNAGASVNKTLTIFPQTTTTGLTISVNKTSVIGLPNPDGNTSDDVTFSVIGGTPPYVISAGNSASGCNNSFLSPVGPWNMAVSGNTVTLDPKNVGSIPASTPQVCTLTVVDNVGLTATTTFTVHP